MTNLILIKFIVYDELDNFIDAVRTDPKTVTDTIIDKIIELNKSPFLKFLLEENLIDLTNDKFICDCSRVKNNLELMRLLIDSGANFRAGQYNWPHDYVILSLCYNDNDPTLKLLLELGVDPNIYDGKLIATVAGYGILSTAEILLEFGADPNCQKGEPLRVAITGQNEEMVRLLMKYGADPAKVSFKKSKFVNFLLDVGFDENQLVNILLAEINEFND